MRLQAIVQANEDATAMSWRRLRRRYWKACREAEEDVSLLNKGVRTYKDKARELELHLGMYREGYNNLKEQKNKVQADNERMIRTLKVIAKKSEDETTRGIANAVLYEMKEDE